MTLKNDTEFLIQILDDYSSGVTNSLEVLAKRNGVNVRTLFMWMRDKSLVLDYMGRSQITFGQAMAMARNVMKAVTVGRTLEDYVLNGRRVEVWHHGRPQFEEDETLVKLGEEFVRDVLGLPDMYRRDANGNRILATRIEYAPAQLIETYARANMPSVYGNKSEVTMKGQVSLGVTTMGIQRPLPPEVQAQIASDASGGREKITETVKLAAPTTSTPEQFTAVDPDLEDILQPVAAPEPERVIRDVPSEREKVAPPTPKPMGYSEVPLREPRNDLERDLFAKLRAAKEKAQQQ